MPKGKWELGGLGAANEHGMEGFNLEGADFSGAYLGAADFSGANLRKADFSQAELYEANLSEADLRGANLSGADLYKAFLSGANLSDANLTNVHFLYANLTGAKLSGSDLRESILDEVNLNCVDLSGADVTGSVFWGVSTTGWKIDAIRARYIYFCQSGVEEKEKYRRNFHEGEFEALYTSLPTVELLFVEGLNPVSLLTLSLLIERINRQSPELGVRMADIHKNEFETRVGIKINNDEDLGKVGQLIKDAMYQAAFEISSDMLTPLLTEILPKNVSDLSANPSENASSSIVVNIMQPTFQFIKADGSTFSGSISQSGSILRLDNLIIKNYRDHREEVDRLFLELEKSFAEYQTSTRSALTQITDGMVEAIRKGKDVGRIQNYWEEIKEGIKTGGAAATIATAIGRILGLM